MIDMTKKERAREQQRGRKPCARSCILVALRRGSERATQIPWAQRRFPQECGTSRVDSHKRSLVARSGRDALRDKVQGEKHTGGGG